MTDRWLCYYSENILPSYSKTRRSQFCVYIIMLHFAVLSPCTYQIFKLGQKWLIGSHLMLGKHIFLAYTRTVEDRSFAYRVILFSRPQYHWMYTITQQHLYNTLLLMLLLFWSNFPSYYHIWNWANLLFGKPILSLHLKTIDDCLKRHTAIILSSFPSYYQFWYWAKIGLFQDL